MSIATNMLAAAKVAGAYSPQELQSVYSEMDWTLEDDDFGGGHFHRLDESDDSEFYRDPRFVEHIDEEAVKALVSFHTLEMEAILRAKMTSSNAPIGSVSRLVTDEALDGTFSHQKSPYIRVLDLCCSHVSHLPPMFRGRKQEEPMNNSIRRPRATRTSSESESAVDGANEAIGIGMNALELRQNPALTEWRVQDLNKDTSLAFLPSDSVDAVLCQLSIDYLTKPIALLKEARRVLRPGGKLMISFSNRVFIQKAIGGWTGKDDIDHIDTVSRSASHFNTCLGAIRP